MTWYEILIIVAACAFVVGVIAWQIVRRKRGKGGCDECGGSCAHCSGCSACHAPQKTDRKK